MSSCENLIAATAQIISKVHNDYNLQSQIYKNLTFNSKTTSSIILLLPVYSRAESGQIPDSQSLFRDHVVK